MSNLPGKFTGTSPPPDGKPVTINPGTNVKDVVSFVLKPIGKAVCVTDIHPADKVIKKNQTTFFLFISLRFSR